jgi:prophage DNA circulation protein
VKKTKKKKKAPVAGKPDKKKKKAQAPAGDGDGHLVVSQKTATLRLVLNKKDETVKEMVVGYNAFPEGVPLSRVTVKTHNTRNMGDFNSLQASVEMSDVTIADPEARSALADALGREAAEKTAQLTVAAARRLFDEDMSSQFPDLEE